MANDVAPILEPACAQMTVGSAQIAAQSQTLHIAVIEKNALIRECVARCLAQGLGHDVLLCSSIEDWLQVRSDGQTSLLIICAWVGEGTYALPDLSQTAMRQRTIVMSNIEDIALIRMTLEQGVRGYIPLSLPLEVAIEAIRLVEAGGVFVPASSLMAPSEGLHGTFTARQAAVVEALCKGKSNKRIAHDLNMCESTVKVHVRNIMKKLHARNRTEVALIVNGLLADRPSRGGPTARSMNPRPAWQD
jgi:DNA-binding NarL/FixJ family response regulator